MAILLSQKLPLNTVISNSFTLNDRSVKSVHIYIIYMYTHFFVKNLIEIMSYIKYISPENNNLADKWLKSNDYN